MSLTEVDLVVKDAKIWTPPGLVDGGLAVKEGKIIAIGKNYALPNAIGERIDVHGQLVIRRRPRPYQPNLKQRPFENRFLHYQLAISLSELGRSICGYFTAFFTKHSLIHDNFAMVD